jgi:hypothetical protein
VVFQRGLRLLCDRLQDDASLLGIPDLLLKLFDVDRCLLQLRFYLVSLALALLKLIPILLDVHSFSPLSRCASLA